MKTPLILGLIVLSSLALASCTNKTTTNISPTPAPVATTPTPTKTPDTMPAMAGMDHGSMDM